MSISGDQNSSTPRPHASTRRTFLAGSTVAAGTLAGSALVPRPAQASHGPHGPHGPHGSHGSSGAPGLLPPQWPEGPGHLNRPQRPDRTLRGILRDIDPRRI